MNKKTTIKDIAKKANVSIATVSRVLRRTDYPVSQDVKKRVLTLRTSWNTSPICSAGCCAGMPALRSVLLFRQLIIRFMQHKWQRQRRNVCPVISFL